ncbi:MAG: hypothetical protein A3A33_02680 [Candidatus Yanofskybacteria bacterium RIFCSPLOWO2_01_FULL_49_25]|uniref:DUF4921 domain-containing protein n=1 Tax=Candidatus Yanofskybacteria bacterium RIFCSPLOWO2_01_FULL_49_25 TaxID=1802701 RepID=A0A1F8GUS7_9BACT|nr:MAG: hypothetical protein A3A33_02680 [Candidatus Yanofskybacteria bacterium RIFCSPLOWO2_01_FULL_49_25]
MESQFRQDPVSGEWVLISANRARKPHAILPREDNYQRPEDCPFENPQKTGHGEPMLVWPDDAGADWRIQVIQNKFPALTPGVCSPIITQDEYHVAEGVGHHEVVIMRDHDHALSDFSVERLTDVLAVYQLRYKTLAEDPCARYIIIFHNYGKEGGATIYHPHSQIMSVPILPPDVQRSIEGARGYFKNNGREVYGVMIEQEIIHKGRIVYENETHIAFCPFVSKIPYEMRVYPKRQEHRFDLVDQKGLEGVADVLRAVLSAVKKALNDPALNYFIHTAPVHEIGPSPSSDFYRWHIEVKPHIKFDAGFEAGTGIKINIIDPDDAAKVLREAL